MVWIDYNCSQCEAMEAWDTSGEQEVELHCPHCNKFTLWRRKWSSVHLGPGSSGEPPR